ELEDLYWSGNYKPYTKEETEKILFSMLKKVPRYCRVMRIMREIPPEYIVAGTIRIDLRKDVEEELRKKNKKLKEIRFREIGFAVRDKRKINLDLKLKTTKYKASEGREFFLEIVNKDDILFGLLRLRLGKKRSVIREIHVYGQALELGKKSQAATQHQGLGKWLMSEAENIAKKNKYNKLWVISGIGAREYYKKLGYELKEGYMIKGFED
ncbi:MAG: GNAT family N-acetyltransferase, partial [Candidatus Nanoarchaeia archaeon]